MLAKGASNPMDFDKFFKFISYAVVFCGFLALWVSGGAGIFAAALFLAVLISSWFLESSRWQISEKVGTALMIFIVPLFYLDWKYKITGFGASEAALVGILAKLILLLTAIKLFQKKGDRDWLFLYLMSFFEVLLAAGISISPLFLACLILYLLATLCAIITFEIRKTSRLVTSVDKTKPTVEDKKLESKNKLITRLPATSIILLVLIIAVGTPLFFALPRVGSAGLGNNQNFFSSLTGFSDSVTLGDIGQLKQSDEIVMRARLENAKKNNLNATRWRGVALDTFDNRTWSKSIEIRRKETIENAGGTYNLDKTTRKENITIQTIYLEPIDTAVLFMLSRPLAIQGNFQTLRQDAHGAIIFTRNDFDRLSYKVFSDTSQPDASLLQADNQEYSNAVKNYLQLPKIDERISRLAEQIAGDRTNRYDKAAAIEKYLQNEFGYTLDMKAGGDEPLADFLFNVREGHCEYFASAMAVMLRTQGIATRIVNGFQLGEYNETADVYVVKQKSAHTWVEVYFPQENVWIPFDPTPFAGQTDGSTNAGMLGSFNQYLEALETFWIQYFVAYDSQEQRSLFRSVKNSFQEYQAKTSGWLNGFQDKIGDWWKEVRGDKGLETSVVALVYGVGYLIASALGIFLVVGLYRKISKLEIWQRIRRRQETTIVEFYERMQKVLASKGFRRLPHQTPLEFAFALQMPEAVSITEKYNRVRFGERNLSNSEAREIENWLKDLEKNPSESAKK
jgi:protein-glutamine gamma-glutamyltransferase